MSEFSDWTQESLFPLHTIGRRVAPEDMQAASQEYSPKEGDLVTFYGTDKQVYQVVRVRGDRVVYKALEGHYADSLKTLRRLGMEQV